MTQHLIAARREASLEPVVWDTIAAFATPPGTSGLAVLRLSGPLAPRICDLAFRPRRRQAKKPSEMAGYTCEVGDWQDLDQVVLTRFQAPHSYTGEEVFEISCHGGFAVRRQVLDSLLQAGARLALPGEFSRRAFLNGKLDLAQAEAVMDLIAAEAEQQAKAAYRQLNGALSDVIRSLWTGLLQVMSDVEMVIEFPEQADSDRLAAGLPAQLQALRDQLDRLRQNFRQSELVSEGLIVVIAGRPNVGKSTLLNRLAGSEKAIVTDRPGTTRDLLEVRLDLDGLVMTLIDTAGLRASDDPIEQEGVRRARVAQEQADLIFWLLAPDTAQGESVAAEVEAIQTLERSDERVIVLAGKSDLPGHHDLFVRLTEALPNLRVLSWSQEDRDAPGRLLDQVRRHLEQLGRPHADQLLVTNSRHRQLIDQASEQLTAAEQAILDGVPLDLVATLLRNAAELLSEITGDEVSEALVETIFSRFCVGK